MSQLYKYKTSTLKDCSTNTSVEYKDKGTYTACSTKDKYVATFKMSKDKSTSTSDLSTHSEALAQAFVHNITNDCTQNTQGNNTDENNHKDNEVVESESMMLFQILGTFSKLYGMLNRYTELYSNDANDPVVETLTPTNNYVETAPTTTNNPVEDDSTTNQFVDLGGRKS